MRRRHLLHSASNFAGLAAVCCAMSLAQFVAPAMAGTIYKCTAADGTIAFRDQPCEAASSQAEVSVHGTTQFGGMIATSASEAQAESETSTAATPSAPRKDCSDWIPPPWQVEVAPPAQPDLSAYPHDADGQPIIVPGQDINLVAVTPDRRDAMSVQTECTDMIDACFHKDNDKRNSYDACFNSAPRCKSARPWEESKPCCPDVCWQKYADLRRQCVDPFGASTRVFFNDHCVPGVAAMLGGTNPP